MGVSVIFPVSIIINEPDALLLFLFFSNFLFQFIIALSNKIPIIVYKNTISIEITTAIRHMLDRSIQSKGR